VSGVSAGLHVLLNLRAAVDDNGLERSALEAGIRVEALARYTIQDRGKRGLLLGYGRVHETALAAAIANAPTLKALA
jgi:GntR family transcriptional regulator/MocR family aminotransferase